MPGSVLVLALEAGHDVADVLRGNEVDAHLVSPVPGNGSEASRLCLAVATEPVQSPLTVIAIGDAAAHLPAVALSLRTAHRRVVEYLLVDADPPVVTDSWPDAPVTIVIDDPDGAAAHRALLRGWRTLPREQLSQWFPADD